MISLDKDVLIGADLLQSVYDRMRQKGETVVLGSVVSGESGRFGDFFRHEDALLFSGPEEGTATIVSHGLRNFRCNQGIAYLIEANISITTPFLRFWKRRKTRDRVTREIGDTLETGTLKVPLFCTFSHKLDVDTEDKVLLTALDSKRIPLTSKERIQSLIAPGGTDIVLQNRECRYVTPSKIGNDGIALYNAALIEPLAKIMLARVRNV